MALTNDTIVEALREEIDETIGDGPSTNPDYFLGWAGGLLRAIQLIEQFTGGPYIRGSESGRSYSPRQVQQIREHMEQHGITKEGAAKLAKEFHRTERGVFQKMQSLHSTF